jgi:hypothetical protein
VRNFDERQWGNSASAVSDGDIAAEFVLDRLHRLPDERMCALALPQWFRPDGPESAEQVSRTDVQLTLAMLGIA